MLSKDFHLMKTLGLRLPSPRPRGASRALPAGRFSRRPALSLASLKALWALAFTLALQPFSEAQTNYQKVVNIFSNQANFVVGFNLGGVIVTNVSQFGSGLSSNDMLSLMWVNGNTNWATIAQLTGATNNAALAANGVLTNNWTGGPITLDSANSKTNTYGGFLVIGGARYQANGGAATADGAWANGGTASGPYAMANGNGTASGNQAWANNAATASGTGSWANNTGTASGVGAWANMYSTASGEGSWAQYFSTASGTGSWAMNNNANASNDFAFVWGDGTAVGSDMEKTFTVYAANGIRLLGGTITGNGSGLTGTGTTFTAGAALSAPSDALKADSNSVVTVVQTNSSGVAVTNQFTLGNANPVITLPTISAGGGGTNTTPSWLKLHPLSWLAFGSVSNATLVSDTSSAANWDVPNPAAQFDPITPQSAVQVLSDTIGYTGGTWTVSINWSEPVGGVFTAIWEFAAGPYTNSNAITVTPQKIITQAVNTIAGNISIITAQWTPPIPVNDLTNCWLWVRRNATNSFDTSSATNNLRAGSIRFP